VSYRSGSFQVNAASSSLDSAKEDRQDMVCDCAVRDGPQDLRIQAREAGKLLRSLFRSLCEIARNSRTLATMTSCPNSGSCPLIQSSGFPPP
jgi:hypothetical protein